MQSALVSGILSAIKASWPVVEPLIVEAATKLLGELVALAKSGGFAPAWKWLEPIVSAAGDEMLTKLSGTN